MINPDIKYLCATAIILLAAIPANAQGLNTAPVGLSASDAGRSSTIGTPGAAIKDNADKTPENPQPKNGYMVPDQSINNKPPGHLPVPKEVSQDPMSKNNNTSLPSMPSLNSH